MTYSRSQKTTDIERRLQILRNQLYGKEEVVLSEDRHVSIKSQTSSEFKFTTTQNQPNQALIKTEVFFLKQDLLKILLLAGLAIGAQIFLYISLNIKLLKF